MATQQARRRGNHVHRVVARRNVLGQLHGFRRRAVADLEHFARPPGRRAGGSGGVDVDALGKLKQLYAQAQCAALARIHPVWPSLKAAHDRHHPHQNFVAESRGMSASKRAAMAVEFGFAGDYETGIVEPFALVQQEAQIVAKRLVARKVFAVVGPDQLAKLGVVGAAMRSISCRETVECRAAPREIDVRDHAQGLVRVAGLGMGGGQPKADFAVKNHPRRASTEIHPVPRPSPRREWTLRYLPVSNGRCPIATRSSQRSGLSSTSWRNCSIGRSHRCTR